MKKINSYKEENEFSDEQWWRICKIFFVMGFLIGLSIGIWLGHVTA